MREGTTAPPLTLTKLRRSTNFSTWPGDILSQATQLVDDGGNVKCMSLAYQQIALRMILASWYSPIRGKSVIRTAAAWYNLTASGLQYAASLRPGSFAALCSALRTANRAAPA